MTLIGSQTILEGLFLPEIKTVIILFSAWWAFLAGSWIVLKRPFTRAPTLYYLNEKNALVILTFLLTVHLIFAIIQIYNFGALQTSMAGSSSLIDAFVDARLERVFQEYKVGWFFEIFRHSYVYYLPLAILLLRRRRIPVQVFLGIWLFAAIISLLNFSRVPFLYVLVVTWVSWLMVYKPTRKAAIVMSLCSIIIGLSIFMAMQVALAKRGGTFVGAPSPMEQVAVYWCSSVPAYEVLLNGRYYENVGGLYSFEAIYYILGKLNLLNVEAYPQWVRAFVFVPYATNVFTFLDAFTLDFGPLGAILGTFLIGVVTAVIYKQARIKQQYFTLVLYSIIVYSCAIASLGNMFIKITLVIYVGTAWVLNLAITKRVTSHREGVFTRTISHIRKVK